MATQVGEAVIKLSFDDKDSSSKISSFGSKAGNVAKNMAKAFTVAFAGMTTSVVAFAKSSVSAFNEAEKAQAKLAQSAKNQNWAEGAVEESAAMEEAPAADYSEAEKQMAANDAFGETNVQTK